jgi:putative ABC transport system substrate-binding protein
MTVSRCVLVTVLGGMMRAPAGRLANAVMPASISLMFRTATSVTSTPNEGAKIKMLAKLKAIGAEFSTTLVGEVFYREFANRRLTTGDQQLQSLYDVFPQELQRLGWTSGRNLQIHQSWASGDDARLRALAADLVRESPEDAIICTGTQATAILKEQTRTIPIVFVNVADPVASGFTASFAHPGGNITGFTSLEYSLAGKWLSILRDIAPSTTRVMVLFNPANSNWTGYLPIIEAGAAPLRVNVTAARVAAVNEIERAIASFAREAGSAMIVLPTATTVANREKIVALAAHHRLPAIYPYDYWTDIGGLVSYGSDTRDLYRRAASYVDRILRGIKPGDLPVQAPVKFELVINLKAARALGLDVSYNLLLVADRLIE